jgi:RNA polymerase sigma factor (sigma-70 family)
MHTRRETKAIPLFFLNSTDRLGRQISPAIGSVAAKIGPRALAYAETLIGDPALAINYLEEAAAAVSAAIEQKRVSGGPAVRNLAAYLFRTFIRMVDDAKRKNIVLEKSLHEYGDIQAFSDDEVRAETRLLLNEVMRTCDRVSRDLIVRYLEGFSWKEIGKQLGISPHAAEVRFSKALDHARKKLKIRRRER